MNTYYSASKLIKKNKLNINNEIINIKDALNRITASNIFSKANYPADNNTAFDGFAINSSETRNLNKNNPRYFKIIKVLAAGDNPNIKRVRKFSTIEIMTGSIIKKPFDTIIPFENIEYYQKKNKSKYIIIKNKIKKSQFLRLKGSDYKKGDKILKKGQLINSAHILALKTLGIEKILVKKKINIVFYPTGNELSEKKNIPFWKIRNSNTSYLSSFIKKLPVNFKIKKIIKDNKTNFFKKEIKKNLKSNTDIIITSGAVSAGKFDFIPNLIKKFKLKNISKGVAIRPGKPFLFARFVNNKFFFGLPGNPISTAACFRFFVLPLIFKSLGFKMEKPIIAKLKNNFSKKKKFTRFIKGKITFSKKGNIEFRILKGQESYKIKPLTKSNAWGIFKNGVTKFKKGQDIECYSSSGFNEFLIN
tara:strand:+ start:36 stop:1289 length:1254 start_codon:yes stop_codon:yes gene_type:complete